MSVARAVVDRLTLRQFLFALACGGLLLAEEWLQLEPGEGDSRYAFDCTMFYESSAMLFLLATLSADEFVRRGLPALRTYATGWSLAALLGAAVYTLLWFDLSWRQQRSMLLFWFENAIEVGVWGALAMLMFYNRTRAARMLQGVRVSELRHAQLEREVIDSRLEAARLRIDAPRLFSELHTISTGLRHNEPQAVAELEALIQRLRALRMHAPPNEPGPTP